MHQLIVIDKLNLGGVTSSLLNYLSYAANNNTIELMIFKNEYNEEIIPPSVKVVKAPSIMRMFGLSQSELWKESKTKALFRGILTFAAKVFGGHVVRRFLFLFVKEIGSYDLAISYTHDVSWKSLTTGCNDFVLYNVIAKHKASFVHCDYRLYGGYNLRVGNIYKRFDTVVCVSEGCRNSFLSCFPKLNEITVVCENFINVHKVLDNSSPVVPFLNKEFKFVTVCRIEKEKGIYRVLEVVQNLIKSGYHNFIWRLVGDGPAQEDMKERINQLGLNDVIELVGRQDPPYQYVNGASLFVLPSYHEAAPMVFGECRVLGVPVLSTRTTSADELIADRNMGVVCDNNTTAIFYMLKEIMDGNVSLPIIPIKPELVNKVASEEYKMFMDRVSIYNNSRNV